MHKLEVNEPFASVWFGSLSNEVGNFELTSQVVHLLLEIQGKKFPSITILQVAASEIRNNRRKAFHNTPQRGVIAAQAEGGSILPTMLDS